MTPDLFEYNKKRKQTATETTEHTNIKGGGALTLIVLALLLYFGNRADLIPSLASAFGNLVP